MHATTALDHERLKHITLPGGAPAPLPQSPATAPHTSPFSPPTHAFQLSQDDCDIAVLEPHDPLRTHADKLIAALYAAKGLAVPVAPSMPARQERTVVARRDNLVVGTLTVGLDGNDGLLADALYGEQLDTVRQQGGRLCELTRFAIDPAANSSALMNAIFSLGFLVGRLMHDMTDAVIEVHPRHATYYGRRFGYRIAGPERICPRVGAPAVLMHVSLLEAEAQIRQDGGRRYACSQELLARLFANA